MVLKLRGGFLLSVQLPTGSEVQINGLPDSRIREIKKLIQQQEGIPSVEQILFLGSVELQDGTEFRLER